LPNDGNTWPLLYGLPMSISALPLSVSTVLHQLLIICLDRWCVHGTNRHAFAHAMHATAAQQLALRPIGHSR
jgi:hypothetical protein